MSQFEFIIPVRREDLRTADNLGQYAVSEVLETDEIYDGIRRCLEAFEQRGPTFITDKDNFDTLYSVLIHFSCLDSNSKEEVWSLMVITCSKLSEEIEILLSEDGQGIDSETKKLNLNTVKMTSYILCQLIHLFQAEGEKASNADATVATGRGRSKKALPKKQAKDQFDFENEKEKGISALHSLSLTSIARLCSPPVMEEELVLLLTNCCYKLLESPQLAKTKSVARDNVFRILATMIKKYNHGLGFSYKILQLLQQYEHLASPLAQAVALFVTEYGIQNVVYDVVREVERLDSKDMARDSAGTKTVGIFLIDLADLIPELFSTCISFIIPYLEREAYTMRNCVLTIMGNLICAKLTGDQLVDKDKALRDKLLDYLDDHMHDVNAFVRSKVLQIWCKLREGDAIPLSRQTGILERAIQRLSDKSQLVRKVALQLVTVCLQRNPFAGKLQLDQLKLKHAAESEKLKKMADNETETSQPDDDDQSADTETNSQLSKQKVSVQYLEDCIVFTELIGEALKAVCEMLQSRQNTDILEAIEFLVAASEFNIEGSASGVQKMLPLIGSKEAAVSEAVFMAYKRLFFDFEKHNKSNDRSRSSAVVKNLTNLVEISTNHELLYIQKLIAECMKGRHIGMSEVQVMWERFSLKIPNTSESESRSAVLLIGYVAEIETDVVKSNVDVLVNVGLGDRAKTDFYLARNACMALLKLATIPKQANLNEPFKYPSDEEIFHKVENLLVDGLQSLTVEGYVTFAEKAVEMIYKLGENPDLICEKIIKRSISSMRQGDQDSQDVFAPPIAKDVPAIVLARFISVIGHIALQQLDHLDINVFGELKRRQAVSEQVKEEKKSKDKKEKDKLSQANKKRSKVGNRASLGGKDTPTDDEAGGDDELELIGAVADDTEAELIKKVMDSEVVTGGNLLAKIFPMILDVCRNPGKYPDPLLRTAASLSFGKCMLVSSDFCEEHLQLFFTIMEKSPEPVIRANLTLVLADLAFRFPNQIEPWTSHLYIGLHDQSAYVRQTVLASIMHLVLNDMIRVRGQVGEVAMCLADDDENIVVQANHFFRELAQKGNAIYNHLLDIISRLYDENNGLTVEKFRSVAKYLLSLVQKDRQLEGLVEKFCIRMKDCKSERQLQDLAFCLAQLPFSERCIRKLQEHVVCFTNKLDDPDVYDSFALIMANAKKLAKPAMKIAVEELEATIEACHQQLLDDNEITENAARALKENNARTPGRGAPSTVRKIGSIVPPVRTNQSTVTKHGVRGQSTAKNGSRSKAIARPGARKKIFSDSSSDAENIEVDEDEEEQPVQKKTAKRSVNLPKKSKDNSTASNRKQPPRGTRSRPPVNFSSDDD